MTANLVLGVKIMAYNELYTGYFAKTNKYIKLGYTPVSVAGRTPEFFKGEKWIDFAPRKELFNRWKKKEISNAEYCLQYMEYLHTIPKEDIEELRELTKEAKFVMCCYEKSGDFCHRHSLACFLHSYYSFNVSEVEC